MSAKTTILDLKKWKMTVKIKCSICNTKVKNIKGLSVHIRYNHPNLSVKDYYDEFIQLSTSICKLDNCKKSTNFQGLNKVF